jgi:hypothetical protein
VFPPVCQEEEHPGKLPNSLIPGLPPRHPNKGLKTSEAHCRTSKAFLPTGKKVLFLYVFLSFQYSVLFEVTAFLATFKEVEAQLP